MHPRIAETLEYLDNVRAQLREAVEAVQPNQRETPPGPDRWSVAQVLQHLGLIEKRITKLVNKKIAGARAEGLRAETDNSPILNRRHASKIADRSFRVTAPEEIRPEVDVDAATSWAELQQSREALRAALLSGDGLALAEIIHPHPVLGEINLYQWILFVGSHEARHVAQVREIADELKASSADAAAAR